MEIIENTGALARMCEKFAASPFVTVDTEFIRETTFWPRLCLVQIAAPEGEAIIDPLARGIDLKPFYDLMADTDIVKVFHAARQDIEIIHHQAGVIPSPLFDTQLAAMVCGFGDSVGYENLIRKLVGAQIDKSSRFTDWAHRPLTAKQLAYALSDVTHLRDAYLQLKAKLDQTGRASWLAEEMAILESPDTYSADPEDAWRRIKFRGRNARTFAIFRELAKWRDIEAQAQDIPRRRILRDDAINEIALQAPADKQALARLRSVPRGYERSRFADGIIAAVRAGRDMDASKLPEPDRKRPPPANPNGLVEMLKVVLRITSEKHHVAQKLIATVPDLEKIAADDKADVPALSGWRRELFGKHALALKHGALSLTMKDGQVVLLNTGD